MENIFTQSTNSTMHSPQYFTINGSPQEKLGKHEGLFTRSYQKSRAIYDAKIRNWAIEYRDNLFYVTDNKDVTETVYFEPAIKNCSCNEFIETQSGTCRHIEVINLLKIKHTDFPKIRPIVFLNDNFKLKQSGGNEGVPYFTPAIRPFMQMLKRQNLPFDERVLSDKDLEPFKDFGISLFYFQKESIPKMIRNKKTVLTLKMGLGKTLCALACCKILNKNKIIVVTPNSLKFQWQSEINRFRLGDSLLVLRGEDLALYHEQKFLIISYEMLNRHPEILENDFDIAITDEIQKIRNSETVSWATLSQLKSEFVFALSGTPIQNNVSDILSLITFLNPFEIKPEWKFYEEHCIYTKAKLYGILPNKIAELRKRFERYIINPDIDYSKFNLPKKNVHTIRVSLSQEQIDLHDSYLFIARPLIAKSINYPLTLGERNKLNSLLTLARMAITDPRLINSACKESHRVKAIQEKIKEIVESGKKVVVYSEWIKALEFLVPFLKENNINYAWFNGELSVKKRDKELRKFIENTNVKVFLSTDSGGLGIDGLQHASHNIIHMEKIWNPSKIDQRNGRLVRTLQKNNEVNVFEFYSGSEIEEMIDDASERKYAIISDMLH